MLLKRKRSANTLSSSASDSSTDTVQSFYPHTKPIAAPFHDSKHDATAFESETPAYLNIRTRKRHRDNRPDAATVHGASDPCWLGAVIKMSALTDVCRVAASTIQRLYDAQRANALPHADESPLHEQQQQHQLSAQQTVTQKSTLHSFWRIAQPVPTATQAQQQVYYSGGPRCEDCDDALTNEDAMDVDDVPVEDKACASCRRPVCDRCAVWSNARVCQACAGAERAWGYH